VREGGDENWAAATAATAAAAAAAAAEAAAIELESDSNRLLVRQNSGSEQG